MLQKAWVRPCLVLLMVFSCLLLAACSANNRSVTVQRSGTQSAGGHASGQVRNNKYIVAKGDTLYSVAFRNKMDYKQLAALNHIDPPYIIHPGQRLVLRQAGSQAVNAAGQTVVTNAKKSSKPSSQSAQAAKKETQKDSQSVAVAGSKKVAHDKKTDSSASKVNHAPGKTRRVDSVAWSWPASGSLERSFKASDSTPGIQIGGNRHAPVYAAADGVVVYSGNGLVGYGELIIIKHNATYLSAYGHNSKRLVKEGKKIKAGQKIAEMGTIGNSYALQFQVRKQGKPVNPLNYLPAQ